ncbi:hypothetical protein [Rickettsia endosymbiont of Orchestes rusci]
MTKEKAGFPLSGENDIKNLSHATTPTAARNDGVRSSRRLDHGMTSKRFA